MQSARTSLAALDTLANNALYVHGGMSPELQIGGELRPFVHAMLATVLMYYPAAVDGALAPALTHRLFLAAHKQGITEVQLREWSVVIRADFLASNLSTEPAPPNLAPVLGAAQGLAATVASAQSHVLEQTSALKLAFNTAAASIAVAVRDVTSQMAAVAAQMKRISPRRMEPRADADDEAPLLGGSAARRLPRVDGSSAQGLSDMELGRSFGPLDSTRVTVAAAAVLPIAFAPPIAAAPPAATAPSSATVPMTVSIRPDDTAVRITSLTDLELHVAVRKSLDGIPFFLASQDAARWASAMQAFWCVCVCGVVVCGIAGSCEVSACRVMCSGSRPCLHSPIPLRLYHSP